MTKFLVRVSVRSVRRRVGFSSVESSEVTAMTENDKGVIYTLAYIIISMLFVFRYFMKVINWVLGYGRDQ